MNISISVFAFGLPRTSPFCGTPLKRLFAAGAPAIAPADVALPVKGRPAVSLSETTWLPTAPAPAAEEAQGDDRDHGDQDAAAGDRERTRRSLTRARPADSL